MNTNKILTDNKKIISMLGGFVVFIVACYFVYIFIQPQDGAALSGNQSASTLIKPEIVSYIQSIEKESAFLKDKSIMDNDFVKNLKDFSERIDTIYPKGRNNPFAP